MLAFGLGVLGDAGYKILFPIDPVVETMAAIGALALAANIVCFLLLYRYRGDNLNMSSTWLCSRNDLIANIGVLIAAGSTYLLASRWPDILIGTMIAGVFLRSAFTVLRQGITAFRTASGPAVAP
jgi:Co/Zn/Cd efflux system component